MWTIVAALALGFAAGTLSGLFGVGGGSLFVPTLTLGLGLTQLHGEATSLLAVPRPAAVGAWRQHSYGNVRWRPGLLLGLAGIGGVVAGGFVAEALPQHLLRR